MWYILSKYITRKSNMSELKTQIDNHGKILIPAKLRKELKFNSGDTIVIRKVDDELRLVSLRDVIEKIQTDFKSRPSSSQSAVDEFLEMRKAEAKLENEEGNEQTSST